MQEKFTVISLWPHALLVGLVAVVALRVSEKRWLVLLSITLSLLAAVAYWSLQNGVAPPHRSTAHEVALVIAGALPLLTAAAIGREIRMRQSRLPAGIQVGLAGVFGLMVVLLMPYVQLLLGCMFTGICL